MITLLLGSDSLAQKQHIQQLAKLRSAEVQTFTESSPIPPLTQLFEQQLFGAPKVVVFDHAWKNLDPEELLEKLADNKNAIVCIIETSLDKRKKVNQEFQKDKRVTVVQLDAPVGTVLASAWILDYCKKQGIAIDSSASMALARALLLDEDAVLNVLHAQNEIEKLKQYAAGQHITDVMVGELVESSIGVDIFALLNAIATRNKPLALKMLEDFFMTEVADEKATAIKVTALLSDQFRSLLIVADAYDRRLQDEAVLAMTGWKSGRLYIMKKLARNFKIAQVKQALSKLENLDKEMKTGSMPPHVVLDLIIADM